MPDLFHTLQDYDFSLLKRIADLWGVDLDAPSAPAALEQLVAGMKQADLIIEIAGSLSGGAKEALRDLLENAGRLPWAQFERAYGEVRVIGEARRERLRPDRNPASPAEALWYRGLLGRAVLNLPPEPQSYAYIPDEILAALGPRGVAHSGTLGRPATPAETAHIQLASGIILDHACTLLAGLRLGWEIDQIPAAGWEIPPRNLQELLNAAGLLGPDFQPSPEPVRGFLEAPRNQALLQLAADWMSSKTYNELRLLPGLVCEGEWSNDPLQTRQTLLELLSQLPPDTWWSLDAFVASLKTQQPDFQRPGGDYDSWFIRRETSTDYLRGFASWDDVDGALVRYMICGPMHWLGFFDLATAEIGSPAAAFRLSAWAADLLTGKNPTGLPEEDAKVKISSHGTISVPHLAPRAVRYQLARFGEWLDPREGEYRYRITPAALEHARQQGLRPAHLITLLGRHTAAPLPPLLLKALERWEEHGPQARLEKATFLRVTDPAVLEALRKNKSAARLLEEEITPTIVRIKAGGEEKLLRLLAEIGYLGEAHLD